MRSREHAIGTRRPASPREICGIRPTAGRPIPPRVGADHRKRAINLMTRFVDRTGVAERGLSRRYLWTDAFAACNLVGLASATGQRGYLDLALRLVDRVHHTLGQHRVDDPRTGWLSGLGPADGEAQPTLGGLRIGKPLPERAPGEPLDERSEWNRDGQYFHYLTRWMHALDQVGRATARPFYNEWARSLAVAAHRAFVHRPTADGPMRLYWKVSVDLSRPLVTSMGKHDAIDGYLTFSQLDATAATFGAAPTLRAAIADFGAMVDPTGLATEDPLGIGGLLVDALRIAQLAEVGALRRDDDLAGAVLGAALTGLRQFLAQPDLGAPAHHRVAFRELGLAIGLAAADRLARSTAPLSTCARARLAQLAALRHVRDEIESFWLSYDHRRGDAWREHEDINEVMLATCMAPDGLLVLASADASMVGRLGPLPAPPARSW